mmetsp:Transcript_48213/g.120698  ORF Transcript_48213/g.120698 Transcript_48213/m.120698 type:complete len:114 (+) Transcript_48213:644-985(+)
MAANIAAFNLTYMNGSLPAFLPKDLPDSLETLQRIENESIATGLAAPWYMVRRQSSHRGRNIYATNSTQRIAEIMGHPHNQPSHAVCMCLFFFVCLRSLRRATLWRANTSAPT